MIRWKRNDGGIGSVLTTFSSANWSAATLAETSAAALKPGASAFGLRTDEMLRPSGILVRDYNSSIHELDNLGDPCGSHGCCSREESFHLHGALSASRMQIASALLGLLELDRRIGH